MADITDTIDQDTAESSTIDLSTIEIGSAPTEAPRRTLNLSVSGGAVGRRRDLGPLGGGMGRVVDRRGTGAGTQQ